MTFFLSLGQKKNVVRVSPGCFIWLVIIWENEVQNQNDGKAQNYMSETVMIDFRCCAVVETWLLLCAVTRFINSSAAAFSKYFDETHIWETMSKFNLFYLKDTVGHWWVKVSGDQDPDKLISIDNLMPIRYNWHEGTCTPVVYVGFLLILSIICYTHNIKNRFWDCWEYENDHMTNTSLKCCSKRLPLI